MLDTDADAVLPSFLREHCEAIHGCGNSRDHTGKQYGTFPQTGDIALEPLGTSAEEMQERLLASGAGRHVRCAYRSRYRLLNGTAYGISPLRAANGRCDGWRFEAGQRISLIAFNWPNNLTSEIRQHQRWFATAAFDGLAASDLAAPRPSHPRQRR